MQNMTELNLGLNAVPTNEATEPPKKAPSRIKRVTIALLLSLLVPGLGQVYVRRPWRGLAMALSLSAMIFIPAELHLVRVFVGLVSSLLIIILWRLWIAGDACYLAWKGTATVPLTRSSRIKSVLAGVAILLIGVYPTPDFLLKRWSYFKAFKIPSQSMCPTICEGERIVADMDAFLKNAPQRGDIILLDFHSAHGPLYIKRIVGIAGDIVSERNGTILVNGKPFAERNLPQVCGKPKDESLPPGELPRFDPVSVPVSSFFVIGDNLPNSYDSRFAGFGLVTSDQIKGRPVYIYWSAGTSRIGCATQ